MCAAVCNASPSSTTNGAAKQIQVPPTGVVHIAGASTSDARRVRDVRGFPDPFDVICAERRRSPPSTLTAGAIRGFALCDGAIRSDQRRRHTRTLFRSAPPRHANERPEPHSALRLRRLPASRKCRATTLYIGRLWLDQGGTYVLANIRGGGEFGPAWHEAGRHGQSPTHRRLLRRRRDLVARGRHPAQPLAADGGRNGGILIGNMLTRYPELFGAMFCTMPLIDMRRYTKLLGRRELDRRIRRPGRARRLGVPAADVGLSQRGPARTIRRSCSPPPSATTASHPGHARKMAAKLQAMGYEAWPTSRRRRPRIWQGQQGRVAFTGLGDALREKIGWWGRRGEVVFQVPPLRELLERNNRFRSGVVEDGSSSYCLRPKVASAASRNDVSNGVETQPSLRLLMATYDAKTEPVRTLRMTRPLKTSTRSLAGIGAVSTSVSRRSPPVLQIPDSAHAPSGSRRAGWCRTRRRRARCAAVALTARRGTAVRRGESACGAANRPLETGTARCGNHRR